MFVARCASCCSDSRPSTACPFEEHEDETHSETHSPRFDCSAGVAQLPDVPTIAEHGFPGFESNSWFIYFAPSGTPQHILDTLNREFVAVLNEPEVRRNLTEQGVEVMATTREETAAFIRQEMKKYAEVVEFSGAKVD